MTEDVITLSSDEDNESPKSSNPALKTSVLTNGPRVNECTSLLKERLQNIITFISVKKNNNQNKVNVKSQGEPVICQTPEVIDLVDCCDIPVNSNSDDAQKKGDEVKNHSKPIKLSAEGNPACKDTPLKNNSRINKEMPNNKNINIKESILKVGNGVEVSKCKIPQASSNAGEESTVAKNSSLANNYNKMSEVKNQTSNITLYYFNQFVDFCSSLEENPDDRKKLVEKLNKYFREANPDYVVSKEFRLLIRKGRDKIGKNNLYLVAKAISDELRLHKNIRKRWIEQFDEVKEKCKIEDEVSSSRRQHKRVAKIQKIIKKLNQLGCIIRELEKQEVDLDNEEDSVYLKLQRFRERFWVVYKKLCEFTNDVDIDRLFNQKIHFTETDYPKINRCIEKWLNKTRSFPDFADVMKVLKTHSAELNLPSNDDALRVLAIEIFQKVGSTLQIRRKYDLWNSFCGFLEDSEDPALKDTELEKAFRENYEARVKKEQEIYQHYAERQERESLQAKEVLDEDAYLSPESGNEDEEEIINIEKSLAERLTQVNPTGRDKQRSDDDTPENRNVLSEKKESKNNFRNCKSLKWRSEKRGTSKTDGSDNSTTETDVESGEKTTGGVQGIGEKPILVEPHNQNMETSSVHRSSIHPIAGATPNKRGSAFRDENSSPKRKCLMKDGTNGIVDLRECRENLNKMPVFDVGFCKIVTNDNFKERRKVFRDLTNLNRFMKKPGLRDKMIGLFTPFFLYSRNLFNKETAWKKRIKVNLKEVKPKNSKCALNEEEKTSEKISSSSSRDSEDKESKDNADGGKEGADFSGQGNGQEEDNNDKGDENRKNGKVKGENDDHEEDEDEEKEDENAESGEHSSNTQKTERENEDSLEATSNENHTFEGTEAFGTENDESCTVKDTMSETAELECEEVYGNLVNNMDYAKSKESEDVEEFENLKNSLEPICVLKEGDTSDIIEKANENRLGVSQRSERKRWKVRENLKEEKEKFRTGPSTRSKLKSRMSDGSKNDSHNQKRLPVSAAWTPPAETSQSKSRKMSASDEERVKRFLMHSPSSISITPPKKLTLSKPPSQSALQALATLRNLKGISATIVKGKPKAKEDVMTAMGGQSRRQTDQSSPITIKRRRTNLPVISNVQSVNTLTPKIVTVQGNVSGFENLWPEMRNNGNADSDSSSIRISKVWGSLPETIVQGSPQNYPACSSRKSNPGTSNQVKKKNPKKQVEYVVLD